MKKLLVIGLLILLLILSLIGVKTFYLNSPKLSQKEVVRKYIDNINDGKASENAQYLVSPDEEKLKELQQDDTKLVTSFVEERIDDDRATVVHEVDLLITKIKIEFKLRKVGDWMKGYSWKIEEVIIPGIDLVDQGENADARNSQRWQDVAAINEAIGQWFSEEDFDNPYEELGLTGEGVSSLILGDGSIQGEGISATLLEEILAGYLTSIPVDPDGVSEYRVGVTDVTNPQLILICTDKIEYTEIYPEDIYPNGMFCESN